MTKDEKIAKLGKEITDRATVLLGKDKITPDAPEYLGINSALKFTAVKYDEKMADDILDIALTMKKRVPLTIEQLAKKNPQFDRAYLEKAMQAISESGLVEFHWENLDGKNPNHEKRWVLDMFVPGSAEIMMINPEQSDMFPETADFFERMAYLPLAGITEMVPPGGAGIGMHVIPVEKAIPAESKSLPIEHLSHWLKKYEGHIGVSVCSCRKQQRIRGEGSGDVEGEWCIGVGDFADYCRETNHGRDITYEEAMEILQKAEDRGYVHQITNIDGENKIFGICNCAVGVCNALRTSQLFNTPNLSASAYVAESDPEKCVACGKCVETCPAGAVRLGQRRVSGVGGAAGSLGLHYGLLAVGCHLALRGAEQFVFCAHRLPLLVKHGRPVAVEQVLLGAGGGRLGVGPLGHHDVAALQLALTARSVDRRDALGTPGPQNAVHVPHGVFTVGTQQCLVDHLAPDAHFLVPAGNRAALPVRQCTRLNAKLCGGILAPGLALLGAL